MSPRKTIATTGRVLRQLRHDPRTLALVFVVPVMLLIILKYVFQNQPQTFQSIAPMMLGIFPLVMMFVVSSVAMLRERSAGTLERLMVSPLNKVDLVIGYALAFSVVALIQASIAGLVMLKFLGVAVVGGTLELLAGAVLSALLGMAIGLFASAFARSEFQAVQFMPAIILPQFLTCGLFISREQMAKLLQWFADITPLTYSVDAMKYITTHANFGQTLTHDWIVVGCFTVAALILGSITIRRYEN
jgi:ABC-2 type transport system permease protein